MIYEPQGVCSKKIEFEIDENNTIRSLKFTGGCPGNTLGLAGLIEGMSVNEAIERMEGITCGARATSCPDQLAKALKSVIIP
jgi:uncharacterized protein TIGR03905